MPKSKLDLILHPIRMQILTSIGARQMTAQDLACVLHIAQTTLYRHLNILLDAGLLKVVEENQKRGTVERVYAMTAPPSLTAEDLKGLHKKDYEQALVFFQSTLMRDMQRYLETKPDDAEIDVLADGMDVSKVRLYLTDDEFRQMNGKIIDIMLDAVNNLPAVGRKPRIFTYLFIPDEDTKA